MAVGGVAEGGDHSLSFYQVHDFIMAAGLTPGDWLQNPQTGPLWLRRSSGSSAPGNGSDLGCFQLVPPGSDRVPWAQSFSSVFGVLKEWI